MYGKNLNMKYDYPQMYKGFWKKLTNEEKAELKKAILELRKLGDKGEDIRDSKYLYEAISWADTPQGFKYWDAVCTNIGERWGDYND